MRRKYSRVKSGMILTGLATVLSFGTTAYAAEETADATSGAENFVSVSEGSEDPDGQDALSEFVQQTSEEENRETDAVLLGTSSDVSLIRGTSDEGVQEAETSTTAGFFTGADGKTYYRDEEGNIVKNQIVVVDKKKYFMDANGAMLISDGVIYNGIGYHAPSTGIIYVKSGWLQVGDDFYFTTDTGVPTYDRWVQGTYYIGKDGKMVKDAIVVWEDIPYYLDKSGWVTVGGKKYFIKSDGAIQMGGIVEFGGKTYFLDEEGQPLKNQIIAMNDKKYYLGTDGVMRTKKGWLSFQNKWYYTKDGGEILCNDLVVNAKKERYYVDSEGVMIAKDFVVIGEKKYYATSNGALRSHKGWIKLNNKWYYTEADGSFRTNALVENAKHEKYYVDSEGVMPVKQIVTVGKKKYYAGAGGLIRSKKGWIKLNGDWYYTEAGGEFRMDDFVVQSSKISYYMGKDGKMAADAVVLHKDKLYFVQKDGVVKIKNGWMKIKNRWYYSAGGGELTRNSILKYKGKNYYLSDDGSMAAGDGVIAEGKTYVADKNGVIKLRKGWVKSGGLWYYSDSNGKVFKNVFKKIKGVEYYFDNDGVMQDNGFFFQGKKMYYAQKGGAIRRKFGWLKVDGIWYCSDSNGLFFRSVLKTIQGKRYYFNADGSWRETAAYYDPTAVKDTSWEEINGRRYHLDKNGNPDSLFGIDVSAWNDKIDWAKVKADGVDFAFIRVGGRFGKTGEIYDDSLGVTNIKEATAVGMPVGVYFFTQAVTVDEAIEEANYTLEKIKGLDVSLPVVIDSENMSGGRHGKIDPKTRTDIIKAFCDTVKAAGYEPMYYAGMAWCVDGYVDVSRLTEYMHWCAQYWIRNQCDDFGVPYQIWQYSDSGTVNGIKGKVDCNIWYTKH